MSSRIIFTWAVIIFLTAFFMGMWYVFQPFLTNIANVIDTATQDQGLNSTSSDQIFTLGRVTVNVTFPIVIIGLWIWGWVESQRKDYRGYYQ